jgi:putative redox protein
MTKITVYYEGNLRTRAVHEESGKKILTDAPKDNHGKGEEFSPTDLLSAALGSCTITLMGIAAGHLKVNLQGLRAVVEKKMAALPLRKIASITVHVYCPQLLSREIQEQLEKAGNHCPVHESLHPEITQHFIFHWGEQ